MPEPGKDILYKVAYDEAVRALSEQQGFVDSLRNRAGLLLTAAAITTSFLGTQVLHRGDFGLFAWLALAGFVAVAAASLAVLWPRRWEVTTSSRDVITHYVESAEPAPVEDLHQDLSLHMHGSFLANSEDLAKLVVLLQVASVLLAVEVVLWIIAVAMNS
jgi:hypothetical protein